MMVAASGLGAGGAIYFRPTPQPQPQPQQAIVPPLPPAIKIEPVRTVSYFMAHRQEMHKKLALCSDNPGIGASDPECLNVETAKQKTDAEDVIKAFSRG
jgi:hypothetical protein